MHNAVFSAGLNSIWLLLQGVKLTSEQFNSIFNYYDKVGEILFKVVVKILVTAFILLIYFS